MSDRPDPEALRRMLAEARAHTDRLPGGYPQAVAETLAWVLGEQSCAPLSGLRTNGSPPTEEQLRSEYDQAERSVYRTAESSIPQSHVVGVESALMWVCGLTTIKPLEYIHTEPPEGDDFFGDPLL
jgi:hypothetical protein